MRIAYILPSLANRGPIIVARDLVNVMITHGHDCVVYYFDDKKEIDFKCPVIKLRLKNKIPFDEYDVIHSHGIRPAPALSILAIVISHLPIQQAGGTRNP